jgi:hypothetical protein
MMAKVNKKLQNTITGKKQIDRKDEMIFPVCWESMKHELIA